MQYTTLQLATQPSERDLQGAIRTTGEGARALSILSTDGVTFSVTTKRGEVWICSPTGVARVMAEPDRVLASERKAKR